MVYVWLYGMCGMCMVCVWYVYGIYGMCMVYMVCIWYVFGMYGITQTITQTINYQTITQNMCMGTCKLQNGKKVCTFKIKVDLHASELGYFTVEGCEGKMPTLGMERGITYIFDQGDETNYYHPLGVAYYPDGAHDDVDELEPGVRLLSINYS